jgi:hypothetical protein
MLPFCLLPVFLPFHDTKIATIANTVAVIPKLKVRISFSETEEELSKMSAGKCRA